MRSTVQKHILHSAISGVMGIVFSIVRLLCCHVRCSATRLSTLIAFVPPRPGTYHIFDQKLRSSKTHQQILLYPGLQVSYEAMFVSGVGGNEHNIPCVYFKSNPNSSRMILFAHGNATDLGMSLQSLALLASKLKTNVFAYDYPGYGPNEGLEQPNLKQTHKDTLQVYKYIVQERKLCPTPEQDLILYGQSLGSVFVCELVRSKQAKYSGVVLHSPLASGVKLVCNPGNTWCCNLVIRRAMCCLEAFPNEQNITRVESPVFVIHGVNDSAIPCHHGRGLSTAVPGALQYDPFFPLADHNDVEILHEAEYYAKLSAFMQYCFTRTSDASREQVLVAIPPTVQEEDQMHPV